jgi:hypothetical protein
MHPKIFAGKLGGRERPLGRPRRRWESIKTDLKESTVLAPDRVQWRALVKTIMNRGDFIISRVFELLNNYQLLKKGCITRS